MGQVFSNTSRTIFGSGMPSRWFAAYLMSRSRSSSRSFPSSSPAFWNTSILHRPSSSRPPVNVPGTNSSLVPVSPSSSGLRFFLSRSPSFSPSPRPLTATAPRAAPAVLAPPSHELDSPARWAARFARSPSGHPAVRACRVRACLLCAASNYGFRLFEPSPPRPRQHHNHNTRTVRRPSAGFRCSPFGLRSGAGRGPP